MKRILLSLFFVCLVLAGCVIPAGCGHAPVAADPMAVAGVRTIAHRGLNVLGDTTLGQNTVEAFRAAATSPSVWGIETDVWQTADNVLVCMHDRDAVYGIKDVHAATSQQVLSSPLEAYRKENLYAPTYAAYLDVCRAGNKVAVVELKDKDMDADGLNAVLSMARERGVSLCVISFYYPLLQHVRNVDPDVDCMWLVDKKQSKYAREMPYEGGDGLDEALALCIREGISLSCNAQWLAQQEEKGYARVAAFHEANLQVGIWTVDSVQDALTYIETLGVDYITSNVDIGHDLYAYAAAKR